jgi:hypothetical protein
MESYQADPGFVQAMSTYLTGDRDKFRRAIGALLEKFPK